MHLTFESLRGSHFCFFYAPSINLVIIIHSPVPLILYTSHPLLSHHVIIYKLPLVFCPSVLPFRAVSLPSLRLPTLVNKEFLLFLRFLHQHHNLLSSLPISSSKSSRFFFLPFLHRQHNPPSALHLIPLTPAQNNLTCLPSSALTLLISITQGLRLSHLLLITWRGD